MYFPKKHGDIPASYVSLPKGKQIQQHTHLKGSRQATLGARHRPSTKHMHPNSHYSSDGMIMLDFHGRHIVATAESWHFVQGSKFQPLTREHGS